VAAAAVCALVLSGVPCAAAPIAAAHGPVAPIASSYLARVSAVPPGVQAKVMDGDQRMWLGVGRGRTVVVLDYRGAPYLRFSPSGVAVNQNSEMFYLNQTPVAVPPSDLTRRMPPRWTRVSGGSDYGWHDGRLHALAAVARSPGSGYAGRWSIPLVINGRPSQVTGGLWHADDPSIVWLWPIVVLLACTLAARRVRNPPLDARVARALGLPAVIAILVAGAAKQLHGRPTLSFTQIFAFAGVVVFAAWALRQIMFRRPTYFTYLAVAFVALWEGAELFPTLFYGFVLAAVPPFLARLAAVVCLGCGGALLLVPSRLGEGTASADLVARDGPLSLGDTHPITRPG
jgi:hypothetical protein